MLSSNLFLMHIARIIVKYLHSSFAVHIVLPVLSNGSPKGSLGPFYSNHGYGLLTKKLMLTLKDIMKSNIILFNQLIPIKLLLSNNIVRIYATGSHLEFKRHFKI